MDTFSHTSNTQRENTNAMFTSEKLDKSDELEDALNYMAINNAKYYESNSATSRDAQGDPTRNPMTVTHSSNRKKKVTDTSIGNFEQILLRNWNLPVVIPTMNPRIDQSIVPIAVATKTLLKPETKEVVADATCGGAWVNMTLRQASRTGVYRSIPRKNCNSVIIKHSPYPLLIRIVSTYPPYGLRGSLQVVKKGQSTFPGLGGNTEKLDVVVDGNLLNDLDYASIFSKVIGHKLSNVSSREI